jgi:hypothetical protein
MDRHDGRRGNIQQPDSHRLQREETFEGSGHDEMVTLYTADGNRIALTHYCSMGNQPRMETPAIDPNTSVFDFSYTGATNLPDAAEPHMHHLALRIADKDHFSEAWTMQAHGKNTTETFQFVRKRG